MSKRFFVVLTTFMFLAGSLAAFLPQNVLAATNVSITTDPCPSGYVISDNDTLCRKYTVSTTWGSGFAANWNSRIQIDSSGNIFELVYDNGTNASELRKVTSAGGAATTIDITDRGYNVYNFRIRNTTGYITVENGSNTELYTINLTSGATTLVGTYTGIIAYAGLAIDTSGNAYAYIYDYPTSHIYKMTSGGTVTTFATISNPNDVSYNGSLSINSSNELFLAYATWVGLDAQDFDLYAKGVYKIATDGTVSKFGDEFTDRMAETLSTVGKDQRVYASYAGQTLFGNYLTKRDASQTKKYDYQGYATANGGSYASIMFGYTDAADTSSNMFGTIEFFGTPTVKLLRTTPTGYVSQLADADLYTYPVIDNNGDIYFLKYDYNASAGYVVKVDFGTETVDFKVAFSAWDTPQGTTQDPIAMEEFNGRLYQAVRGNGSPYWIYVRSTADGVFDGSDAGETWDRTGVNGQTSRQVSLAKFNNGSGDRLYIAERGSDSKIYTKSLGTDGVWDSTWNEFGGTTTNTVAMKAFNGRLYQAVRGNGSDRIYVRSSADGVFDGGSGENWTLINGQTYDDMALETFNSKLYLGVRGATGRIFIRNTSDGTTWTSWTELSGNTPTPLNLATHNGKLYMSVRGGNSNIYTRFTDNGTDWFPWSTAGTLTTPSRIEMKSFSGVLYQAVRGYNAMIYTRKF